MTKKSDKIQSEFDEKLRESRPADESAAQASREELDRDTTARDRYEEDRYSSGETPPSAEKTTTIPVLEEQVHIDKKTVETGRLRISKDVHEEEVTVDLPTLYEEADVERVEINQYVDTPPPPIRYEGDKMIIPVVREVLVVEKRTLVVEELHITKRIRETHETQQVTLRKESVQVDRQRNENLDPDRR
jgi:uncharacterized protein (TIGR02271 family)